MQKIKDFIYYNRKELLIGLLCCLAIINFIYKSDTNQIIEENVVNNIEKEEPSFKSIIVDIKGEINSPGTYELKEGERVKDVIEKAGGLTSKANVNDINLSEKVKDEMVIIIPSIDDIKKEEKIKTETNYIIPKNNEVIDKKISINTASKDILMTIQGIGEKKAEAIIEYRNKNGKFNSIEEIMNVSGIGKSIFDKIKNYIKI